MAASGSGAHMVISGTIDGGVLWTRMVGVVSTDDFLGYYRPLLRAGGYRGLCAELVDGSAITSWRVPAEAQWELATVVARHIEQLRGIRVAMVAQRDHVYGSFRMWELLRADLDYEVRTFRTLPPALQWLAMPCPSDSPPR